MRILFNALSSSAEESDCSGCGFFDTSPERDVFFDDVDVVPFVEGFGFCVVEFVVEDGSTPVFHGIFECGHD